MTRPVTNEIGYRSDFPKNDVHIVHGTLSYPYPGMPEFIKI